MPDTKKGEVSGANYRQRTGDGNRSGVKTTPTRQWQTHDRIQNNTQTLEEEKKLTKSNQISDTQLLSLRTHMDEAYRQLGTFTLPARRRPTQGQPRP